MEFLPASHRIAYYQQGTVYQYKRARMLRNAKNKAMTQVFANQAAKDSATGRELLFALIDLKAPPSFNGRLTEK